MTKSRDPVAEGMKHYLGTVSMGIVGCKRTFEFEIEDTASEDEVEQAGLEAMFDVISWDFEPVNE